MISTEPPYIELHRSGELEKRARGLESRLASCDICPRECGVNRLEEARGFCRSGRLPLLASACAHHGEEPAVSGLRGSGTVFFGNCNMRCVYCQNHQISQGPEMEDAAGGRSGLHEIDCRSLAAKMLYLQDQLGCHNINLVSPSHFVPQIVRAVAEAVPLGLRVPLVYNTSSYDSLGSLKALDGVVSVYLADLRYASDEIAERYSEAPGYVERARQAIKEMYRQVGDLVVNEAGVARSGLIVRLLILPNGLTGIGESVMWLARELGPTVTVSLMSQYSPRHRAGHIPELCRAISKAEYDCAVQALEEAGLENGWVQHMGASEDYLPDFARDNPFAGQAGGVGRDDTA